VEPKAQPKVAAKVTVKDESKTVAKVASKAKAMVEPKSTPKGVAKVKTQASPKVSAKAKTKVSPVEVTEKATSDLFAEIMADPKHARHAELAKLRKEVQACKAGSVERSEKSDTLRAAVRSWVVGK
jgi:hypothetical protein